MPFTLAHPSILFPLRWINKKYISLTGLVIGSMAPDFEYFLFMNPAAYHSHSISGIFLFDLPITFLLAFLYHNVVKRPLLQRFPFFKDKYLLPDFNFSVYIKKNWLVFLISALIGIVSHLFWDAFCHAQGYFVIRNVYLNTEIKLGSFLVRRCYIVWYISSIIGLLMMLVYVFDFKKIIAKSSYHNLRNDTGKYWAMILFFTVVLIVVRVWLGLTWSWFRHLVITAIGAFIYALVLVSWMEKNKIEKTI